MIEWSVEIPGGGLDEVRAHTCVIEHGGVLAFYTSESIHTNDLLVAYAPGSWKTVASVDAN